MKARNYRVTNELKHGNDIEVRKIDWNFEQLNKYYLGNNSFMSAVFTVLSLAFPEGERFFIRSVNRFKDHADTEKLREEIKAFIAQEAQHGSAHDKLNNAFDELGYNVKPFQDTFENVIFRGLEDNLAPLPFLGGKIALAATAAAEHFTATWANIFFKSRLKNNMPQEMKQLFYWHALEEMEHKNVAFDLMQKVDDNYFLRTGSMVLVFTVISILVASGVIYFAMTDEEIDLGQFVQEMLRDIFDVNEHDYSFTVAMFKAFISYLRPGFHPDDDETGIETARKLFNEEFARAS